MRTIPLMLCGCICLISHKALALSYDFIRGGSHSQSYTHLSDTNQSQIFEPMSSIQNFPKLASVNFAISNKALQFDTPEFTVTWPEQCKSSGFTLTSCPDGGTPSSVCPYDSSYFASCCDSRYKYNRTDCSYPNTISGDACGGKYMCYCDRSLYPIESCAAPQVPNGDSCTEDGKTYYSDCICPPSTYTETCSGSNLQGSGTGCSINGKTKYASCECKAGYTLTCSDLGPQTPTDYCLKNGIKYYRSCKTCEYKCTLAACPSGTTCTYEECSGKYCATGCAVGSYDVDNYWCDGALRCLFGS